MNTSEAWGAALSPQAKAIMNIEIPIWCRVVAQREAIKVWGDTGPQFENILRRELLVAPADIGKFAVSVVLPDLGHESFITPRTATDLRLWSFGLDDANSLQTCVQLFDTCEEAAAAALRFRWQKGVIYEVIPDGEKEGQILLIGRYLATANGPDAIANFFAPKS